MKKDVKFRRNVYVIMLTILALAILIQIARSQFVLQFNHNEQWLNERDAVLSEVRVGTETVESGPYACLAYLSNDEESILLKDNAARTLQYMKQPVHAIDLVNTAIDYSQCSHVMLTTGKIDIIEDHENMVDYVFNGGAVFFMHMPEVGQTFHQIYRKLGVISFEFANLTNGIHLTSNVLIGEKGLKTGEGFLYNTSTSLELDDEANLLAESLEGVPLLWNRTYGSGSFTVFNGDSLQWKYNRGLIAGAVSLMKPDYLYPVFNAKVFYIDDFPAPITKEIKPDIYREYQLDMPTFYREVWWPDMLKAAKRFNVKYTAAVIQSYGDNVTPPFRDPVDEERHNLIAYGREVIKSGGEISLHGYNHQSLQTNKAIADYFEYKTWNSQDDMEESIQEAIRYLDTAFPNYSAMSYVPPSNVLGKDGREALKASWPNLTVIASLYDTDFEGRAYVQEYEISDDGVIEMPRVTSGYFEVPYMRWLEANAVTSIGLFSHFLHPDDLTDRKRNNNQNWENLYKDFTDLLNRLNRTYPWLRDLTSTEAGLAVANTLQSQVKLTRTPDRIMGQVDNYKRELYYILRTDRKITRQENCYVTKMDDQTYLVTILNTKFVIGLGG